MNQKEINEISEALREQGLTWNQTNFSVSLVRNMQDKEREECAKVCDEIEHDYYRDNKCATAIRKRSNVKLTGSPASGESVLNAGLDDFNRELP